MQSQPLSSTSQSHSPYQQIAHIIVAGLWSSDKNKLIWQISDTPLEKVDIVGDKIPVKLPQLVMGQLHVDARLTARIWGAPDHWRHDYVNYLVNIKAILNSGGNHRVMGMIVVVDSLLTATASEEAKLLRLIANDWKLPYIVLASHPYDPHARTLIQLREQYAIDEAIPVYACDVSDPHEANRGFINLLYHAM